MVFKNDEASAIIPRLTAEEAKKRLRERGAQGIPREKGIRDER